jgi:hypothetical protein
LGDIFDGGVGWRRAAHSCYFLSQLRRLARGNDIVTIDLVEKESSGFYLLPQPELSALRNEREKVRL